MSEPADEDLTTMSFAAPPDRQRQAIATTVRAHVPTRHRVLRALADVGAVQEQVDGPRFAAYELSDLRSSDVPGSTRRVAALQLHGGEGSLPTGPSDVVEQALAALSPPVQRVLRACAVLGADPSVAEAAEVAATDPLTVLDAVSEAAAVGLVVADRTDRFSFRHELIRSVLEETSGAGERLEAHARAAAAIEATGAVSPEGLARLAHHAVVAAPRSVADARSAVAACEVAACSMAEGLRYEQADRLLSAAVQLHESCALGPPPGRLVVRWAQAAMHCGRMNEARQRFERAVAAARREDDPGLVAEAALGLGGYGVMEQRSTLERARVLGLQRSALAGLSEGQPALRCRLQARLAAEEAIDGGPVEQSVAAVEAARDCGDSLALAEALALYHHVSLMPEHDQDRLALAEELIDVAIEAGDGVLGLMGLWFRTVDLFHLGDSSALPSLEELRQRAAALGSQHILAGIDVIDVMLLIRAGRLAEAEDGARRAHERAAAVGEVDALNHLAAQRLGIGWLRGRDADLVDEAQQVAGSPDVADAWFAFRASAAALTARAGQPEQARAILGELAPQGLAAVPQSSSWLIGMAAMMDLAATLEDADLARAGYDLLLPYAGVPCLGGFAVLCLGSTEHLLGIAASTFGDHDRAVDHLERAVAENRRLDHRPMVAIAQADLANTLVHRGRPDDPENAVDLLARSVAVADDLAMDIRAVTWQHQLEALRTSLWPAAAGRAEPRRGTIRRHGRRWEIALDDHRVRLRDLVGMGYLAELLTRPGQPIPALTLASGGSMPRPSSHHELLDDEARAAYASRVQELTAELAEAEDHNDLGRAEQRRVELDVLVDELEAATGLLGRPRTFTDARERARSAVRKAIKRALDLVDHANPVVADAIHNTISTGVTCIYTPDPRTPIIWSIRGDGTDEFRWPATSPLVASEQRPVGRAGDRKD